jgi:prephenate dehydrogenase
MVVTIIGLGLIGGSIGKRLKENQFAKKVIGVDYNNYHEQQALALGLVDEVQPLDEALAHTTLVILAIPVDAAVSLMPSLLDKVKTNVVVIDMGSTKEAICTVADKHPRRENFVATHPMAGTEYSGPGAAKSDLFDNKMAIICDQHKSAQFALKTASELFEVLKMKVIEMEAAAHDLHIAYVSHLSHITSFVLSETVLEKESEVEHIFNMAGSGFASTVRLAKSSSDMWLPIFLQNSKNVSDVLETYIQNLKKFKNMVDSSDAPGLEKAIKNANLISEIIN